jgi:DNA polymerase-3 subunit gamma/tau
VEQVAQVLRRVAAQEQIEIEPEAVALIARHATGSFRDALGTLEQLVTYAGEERIVAADVLAVLGVADAEQLFEALDAVAAHDPADALRAATKLVGSGRDPGQVLRDLEVHARELLAVQVLGVVPEEIRITPERDQRLLAQSQALTGTDVVRVLDLVSAALEATANGAQARIQLELVLLKAAAPEIDPSTSALLARIERLEHALHGAGPAPSVASAPASSAPAPTPSAAPTPPAAPAIAAAPSSTAPRADAAPQLESLVASWPAVVDQVRQSNAMLAALLADARPVALAERDVTIAFPSGAAFLKRKAEQDDHRRATAEALRSVTGAALALHYELRDDTATPAPEAEPSVSGEELVRRFMEEFDAEEVLDDPDQETEAK